MFVVGESPTEDDTILGISFVAIAIIWIYRNSEIKVVDERSVKKKRKD